MSVPDYAQHGRAELVRLLQMREAERRFGLVWERDEIEREKALNDDFVALDLVPKLCQGPAPWCNTLIEGDNLDALRNLATPLAESVKCVYIDPPYNTGGEDFIYNDRYMEREDRYRHSKWLEYIYRRLTVAKSLLAPDGVIFVSIGEDEHPRLSLLMEQVFGASAKVGVFVWRRRSGANHEKRWNISADHEYVLCYANPGFTFSGEEKKFAGYKNPDNDPRGDWTRSDLTVRVNYKQRPNNFYPLRNPARNVWYPCNPDACWRFGLKERMKNGGNGTSARGMTMQERIKDGQVLWPNRDKTVLYETEEELLSALRRGDAPANLRLYLSLDRVHAEIDRGEAPEKLREFVPPLSFWIGKKIGFGSPQLKRFKRDVKRGDKPVSTWFAPSSLKAKELEPLKNGEVELLSCGYTQEGTRLLSEMIGNKDFSFPKPMSLVKALVKSATDADSGDIVMDFFAGSGTTGHAVMALNEEDGGNRRFVLVSSTEATDKSPRRNICLDIAAKRLSAAVNGYEYYAPRDGGKKTVAGLGGGFAYLRTARIARRRVRDEICNAQIWTALQMLHFSDIIPWEKGAKLAMHESAARRVFYLASNDDATLNKAGKMLRRGNNTVYTWQPALAIAALGRGAKVERIPEFILERYKMRASK